MRIGASPSWCSRRSLRRDTTTARTTTNTPESVAPGVELADGGSAANRLVVRVPPADIGKTVLIERCEIDCDRITQNPMSEVTQ